MTSERLARQERAIAAIRLAHEYFIDRFRECCQDIAQKCRGSRNSSCVLWEREVRLQEYFGRPSEGSRQTCPFQGGAKIVSVVVFEIPQENPHF